MLLEIKDLKIYFKTDKGTAKSVDGVNINIEEGQIAALVGESGSGKSVTSLSIMGLNSGKNLIKSGEILFEGRDLNRLDIKEMRKVRGKEITMIFQEPMTALNPALKIGYQLSEVYRTHFKMTKSEAMENSINMLKKVDIKNPEVVYNSYSYELSGGMRQRVMIAMALASKPKLIIADEPTTALDVTVEAEIIKLMKDLQKEVNNGLLFISHDLSVVSEIADYVYVMYAGKIVESGKTQDIFSNPLHPYTKALIKSRPVIGEYGPLPEISGQVPSVFDLKDNCHFCDRCRYKMSVCEKNIPDEINFSGHKVSCFLYSEGDGNE